MKNTKLLAVTLFVVMAIWQPAMAGNGASAPPVHKRYVGFDVGASHATGGLFGSETTSGSTGFALRFGYQFNRHLAAEIGYAYFGDFQFDNRPAPNNCPGRPPGGCDITTKTTLSAPLINVVGLIPLGERWALKARAGASRRLTFDPWTAATGIPAAPFPSIVMRPEIDPSGLGFVSDDWALTINVKKNRTPTIVMSESSLLWMGKGILQRALSSAPESPGSFHRPHVKASFKRIMIALV